MSQVGGSSDTHTHTRFALASLPNPYCQVLCLSLVGGLEWGLSGQELGGRVGCLLGLKLNGGVGWVYVGVRAEFGQHSGSDSWKRCCLL